MNNPGTIVTPTTQPTGNEIEAALDELDTLTHRAWKLEALCAGLNDPTDVNRYRALLQLVEYAPDLSYESEHVLVAALSTHCDRFPIWAEVKDYTSDIADLENNPDNAERHTDESGQPLTRYDAPGLILELGADRSYQLHHMVRTVK